MGVAFSSSTSCGFKEPVHPRLLNIVNTLGSPRCQRVIKQWETLRAKLPQDACIYTVSIDPPQMQASFQDMVGVLHQILSAHRGD